MVMEVVDALEKLDFSFWQLLILGFALALRRELRALLLRLWSVKVGDKEVIFHRESIAELKEIRDQLEEQPSSPQKAITLINNKIEAKVTSALSSIKRETMFLWPAIEKLKINLVSTAQIQSGTLQAIADQLKTIEDAGLITYDMSSIGPEQYGICELRLKKLDHRLEALIDLVSNSQLKQISQPPQ